MTVRNGDGADNAVNLFYDLVGRRLKALNNTLGRLFLDGNRLVGFFLDLGGSVEVRLAKFAFGGLGRGGGFSFSFGNPIRREAGGNILRAVNFLLVAGPVVNAFFNWLLAGRLRARLLGRPFLALGVLLVQTAAGPE